MQCKYRESDGYKSNWEDALLCCPLEYGVYSEEYNCEVRRLSCIVDNAENPRVIKG